ncbi:MAG TPA: hypothetical protein VGI66_03600 [Streptosporangiaceae bacterium]|jgi:hypothetical protein
MAGFDAGTVVSPLDFNFEPYTKVKGRIPEPSDDQISEFMEAVKKIMVEAQKEMNFEVDVNDTAAVMAAVEKFDGGSLTKMSHQMSEAYGNLCSGRPSAKQLLEVPLRVRLAFYAWIQNEVVSPEAGPGAGMAQVTPLKRSAAG